MKISRKFNIFTIIAIGICMTSNVFSQVTIGSSLPPHKGSLLDLKQEEKTDGSANSTKGLGLPRVALTALDKLEPCVETDATSKKEHIGLIVYNTTDNSSLTEGVYAWDGDMWTKNIGGSNTTLKLDADNGLSIVDDKVYLGGALVQPTTITGDASKTLTFDAPTNVGQNFSVAGTTALKNTTVTGNLTTSGTTTTTTSTVTGNETIGGTLKVAGSTTLNGNTTIELGEDKELIINDGKVAKAGKVLMAMDDTGKAEWQLAGAKATTDPVKFEPAGLTYDPKNTSAYTKTGAKLTLPPGRWMVQCVLLFEVQNPKAGTTAGTMNNHWVQCRMQATSGSSATFDGASIVSGTVYQQLKYNMISGYFIVTNRTNNDKEYEFTVTPSVIPQQGNVWDSSLDVKCFAGSNGENAIVAFALAE